MKDFKDVQIGDFVFTIVYGWIKVRKIFKNHHYPILCGNESFNSEGKPFHENTNPSAWTYDPLHGTKPPIDWKKVEVGTEVEVRNSSNADWASGKIITYNASKALPYGCIGYGEGLQKEIVHYRYARLGN